MNAVTTIRPDIASGGLRPLSSILPCVVGDIFARLTSFAPRYGVRNGRIISLASHTEMTTSRAREQLMERIQDALTTPHQDLVDIDLVHVVHLVRAIRAAEGTDPTEPSSMAEAA